MSIKYNVVPNALRPGEFYPRPVAITTRTLETVIEQVARTTTISSSDVKAVVDAFINEIVVGLLNSDRVSLDGFVDFRPRMSQVLNSASGQFDPQAGGQLLIAATVKPGLTKRLRDGARYERLRRVLKQPGLESFEDGRSQEEGVYSAGGIARITGDSLRILDPQSADEGIFFIAADGTETKVTTIQDNGMKKLNFEIPESLSGVQQVQVRTRYSPGTKLRVGELEDEVLVAEG